MNISEHIQAPRSKKSNDHLNGITAKLDFLFLSCLQVKLTGPDNKPVANEPVHLLATPPQNVTLTTDKKGMASFSLDTSLWVDTVNLQVGYCSSRFIHRFLLVYTKFTIHI